MCIVKFPYSVGIAGENREDARMLLDQTVVTQSAVTQGPAKNLVLVQRRDRSRVLDERAE